jgi:hydroxymethylglutaryl-CoA synthase
VTGNASDTNCDNGEKVGVSGFKLYLPPFRVQLKDWCGWTGNSWEKVSATVGDSFRVAGPWENVYTMAANAVIRLILAYNVDPRRIGFLGLGTESSTDNSAGAIIVKGIVDAALEEMGLSRISRHCEVPEFKHACLGGVYALKSGLRYLKCDGRGRKAIVVSADIAEYERGSSGEPTQGACAVAQLLEEDPKLYSVDLRESGSAAAFRGVDFRKPVTRRLSAESSESEVARLPDFPVFNGGFSTICYTDQSLHAVARLLWKLNLDPRSLYHMVDAWFLHRPYHRMPINVMAALYVWGLSRDSQGLPDLEALCKDAGADYEKMLKEAHSSPDLYAGTRSGGINEDAYPEAMKTVKHFRYTPKFDEVMSKKMYLGTLAMRNLGNVYTASLPAWIAAGFNDALDGDVDLSGKILFTLGYGSGDAAEAMLIRVLDGWREAAEKIGFKKALENAVDLQRQEYEALHRGFKAPCPSFEPSKQFVVDGIGEKNGPDFQDIGIEYYRYVQ